MQQSGKWAEGCGWFEILMKLMNWKEQAREIIKLMTDITT